MLPATLYVRAQRLRRLIAHSYRELFDRVDFLAMPVGPEASYRYDATPVETIQETGDLMTLYCRFNGPFNLTGLPAISVPCGFVDNGMPVGLQLVARPFAEPALFQVADVLERQIGRFGRPVLEADSL